MNIDKRADEQENDRFGEPVHHLMEEALDVAQMFGAFEQQSGHEGRKKSAAAESRSPHERDDRHGEDEQRQQQHDRRGRLQ